ncbi:MULTISPECIES: hypothetical protein [unclassified Moorena]|uniref:hypothetical protein n=1 Tax=unclassified Moorena TaxID=2683338 RepID=UPI0013CBABE4|nr:MULTISPECIES: hypothetical protein [unclassified Moorena]NEO18841.1 hypothetical protein [Moorena sp. SIO4A5]NEQ62044.1 hypothetical protein [Moorena sp. SIO4A1]
MITINFSTESVKSYHYSLLPTPVLMQSLMGETPKTALHRYSLLPTPYSLLPIPFPL